MAHFIALPCSALARSVYAAAAVAEPVVSVRLFDQGLHNAPRNLLRRAPCCSRLSSVLMGGAVAWLVSRRVRRAIRLARGVAEREAGGNSEGWRLASAVAYSSGRNSACKLRA